MTMNTPVASRALRMKQRLLDSPCEVDIERPPSAYMGRTSLKTMSPPISTTPVTNNAGCCFHNW